MIITVINGNTRRGSTWHCADAVVRELQKYGENEVTEFYLPKDMPNFCVGCFSCIYNGEDKCPHAASVKPIADAILGADLIILTSPVYGFDVSGGMKALIDHLCYMWMSHRPDKRMFNKVALTVSTSAGAGLGHTTKTMKNSLTFWGVKKIYSFKAPVAAKSWSDIPEEKRAKFEKKAGKLAVKIARSVKRAEKLPNPLFRSFFFGLMASMQKKNNWNKTDRDHWEREGWIMGKKPY